MSGGGLHLAQCPGVGSASPDDYTLILREDERRVRQDIRVNHSIEGHALYACRKAPS